MAKLGNLARMTVASAPGTGSTITLGSAVSGFISFASAGIANGDVITYAIEDGSNREIGTATYSSTGPSLTGRTVLNSTNSNAAIAATASAQVFITAAASDILSKSGDTMTGKLTVPVLNLGTTTGTADGDIWYNGLGYSCRIGGFNFNISLRDGTAPFTAEQTFQAGAVFETTPVIKGTAPKLDLWETDYPTGVVNRHWNLSVNGGNFTLGIDLNGDGTNDTPHPLFMNQTGYIAKIWGYDVWTAGNFTLDLSTTPPTSGQVLQYNGTNWVPVTISAGAASTISFTPTGNVAATNVQNAIAELDSEKIGVEGGSFTGGIQVPFLVVRAANSASTPRIPIHNESGVAKGQLQWDRTGLAIDLIRYSDTSSTTVEGKLTILNGTADGLSFNGQTVWNAGNFTPSSKLDASTVSTFGASLIDDADASSARTTLGVGSMATRNVTISTSAPSGGSNGDFWAVVT